MATPSNQSTISRPEDVFVAAEEGASSMRIRFIDSNEIGVLGYLQSNTRLLKRVS